MSKEYHIGVDLHRRFSKVAVVDKKGEVVDTRRLENDMDILGEYFKNFKKDTPVVVESTSGWEWFSDLLEEVGMDMKLANPHKVKLIAEATIKTDKVDAITLAQLERTNFLPLSYLAPKEIRGNRELLRHRFVLVRIRTSLKNRVHSILTKRGIIPPSFSDLFGKEGRKFLASLQLPDVYKKEMATYLELIDTLNNYIKIKDIEIKKLVKGGNKQAKLLMTVPGISYLSGLLLISEIGDINRFPSFKKLCSYGGLVPTTDQSADKLHYGHLKKDSNKYIRGILVEAVEHAIKKDIGLSYTYQKLLRKRGKNSARVAVARKLLVSIYYILKNNESYKERTIKKLQFQGKPVFLTGH